MTKEIAKYHKISKIFHWLMAILVFGQVFGGIYMVHFMSQSSNRFEIYNLHKSFGAILLILIFLRVFNRLINKPPKLPNTISKIEQNIGHLVHYSLYLLMILIPLSGYLMSNSYGFDVNLFNITLPNLMDRNYELAGYFSAAHKYLGYTILLFICLHIAGTIRHVFFDRQENNILKRIT